MKKILIILTGLFVITGSVATAATFKVGEQVDHSGAAVSDDLYMVGGLIDSSANIVGDGVAAGGEIAIQGDVTGDVLAAGGTIDLLGVVSDDARIAAGEVLISGTVRDDLIVAGGYVRMLGDANVGGDVVVAAGAAVINGTISGDVTFYGGEVALNGVINGDVDVKHAEKVTLGDGVTIAGNLTYSTTEELVVPEGAFIGGEVIKVDSPMPKFNKDKAEKVFASFQLFKLVSSVVAAVVLVLLFKKLSTSFGLRGVENFWKNALIGFIVMVLTPIVVVLLLMSMIGSFLGGILFLLGTTLLVLAKAYSGILAGALLSKWTVKKVTIDWKWAVLGVVALAIVKLVPVVGMLICFFFTLASFGTILVIVHRGIWLKR